MTRTYRIAAIPGDGIGKEVVPEGVKALRAAADTFGFDLDIVDFDFASAEYYVEHGQMLPADWFDHAALVRRHLLRRRRLAGRGPGPRLAVGQPAAVPPRLRPVRVTCAR